MLFYLYSKDDKYQYLLEHKEYVIGRKECDIIITNDLSISRKHSALTVQHDSVTIMDCCSKYGTYVNDIKLEDNVKTVLQPNDVIRFGMLESVYSFKSKTLITTTSSMNMAQKTALVTYLKHLQGKKVSNWSSMCTHVTVGEFALTVKVLCALIKGIPIVSLNYWEDYANSARNNLPPPIPENYKLECAEATLGKNVKLDFNVKRQTLFRGKTFLFYSKADEDKVAEMIGLAGGNTISWDAFGLKSSSLRENVENYIIIQMDVDPETIIPAYQTFLAGYNKTGRRLIPFSEIALAIIKCSCDKDCNPNFDRKATVLGRADKIQQSIESQIVLAGPSQSQATQYSMKTEIINDSLDILDEIKEEEVTGTKRTLKDVLDATNPSKRAKLTEVSQQSKDLEQNMGINWMDVAPAAKPQSSKRKIFSLKTDEANREQQDVHQIEKRHKPDLRDTTGMNLKSFPGNFDLNVDVVDTIDIKEEVLEDFIDPVASSTRLNLSSVTSLDVTKLNCTEWISKSTISNDNTIENKSNIILNSDGKIDDDILKYIESFKNTLIIKEMPLTCDNKTTTINDSNLTVSNKNFKRFKKVQPLRIQSIIMPQANYQLVVCNSVSDIIKRVVI